MERLTVKQLDGTYHIYDYKFIREAICCDENNKNWFSLYEGEAVDKLGKYEDLEEQGLLLRLPCKVGDAVWDIAGKKIREQIVDGIEHRTNGFFLYANEDEWLGKLGELVFLTKEEAEKALEEMEKNNG